MSTTILRTASRFIVPLGLLFAFFIYFKGHQTPGGGFVGGLVASVSLVVHRMAMGGKSLERMLPIRERTMIAIGLLCAVGTGTAALFFGLPFFTSNHGYLSDAFDNFEWATVMVFDLGVMLVVTGVVVGMIDALSIETEEPDKEGSSR
ncbi:MAG: Na(+)/H(+) antiporter subunit B [Phycisphaera sp.]|nr:Na(+)/H(+) antiporter subunit B [Phycisphaera sp.]